MKDITGKNALVTGSSRGVGRQIAIGLAEQGCNIIIHGRTKDSSKETLNLLKKYNVNNYSVFGDLSDKDQINNLITQVKVLGIQVDILYNNAAIMRPYREDIWTHTEEDWLETYKVNVLAMYKLCSAFIPSMIKNNYGRVVNVSSRIMNQPQLSPYGASKWAVDKLSHDLAFALKDTPVRLNFLDPGWLQTDMGGENAENPVEAVIPGALVPVLIDNDGPNGEFFSAMDFKV
ncbi:MAG: SDR family oxidoreductase [Flavobacteriaceae bacterium]|nr:SDR family oxidoreductase [Bacteroidia bacterium]NNK82243.1 SDR family oxidoreductase [Flavobacteriaceae bacterium]